VTRAAVALERSQPDRLAEFSITTETELNVGYGSAVVGITGVDSGAEIAVVAVDDVDVLTTLASVSFDTC